MTEYRKNYDRLANQCNNLWLRKNYNLSAYSTIQYCTANNDAETYQYNYLHLLFLVLLLVLLVLVLSATFIDMNMNQENSLKFYQKDLSPQAATRHGALLCFSLPRNWYRLTAAPKTELGQNLRFILAMRYLTLVLYSSYTQHLDS